MIDDCGNKWNCITVFGTRPHHHTELEEGVMVKVGFPHAGMNDTIYI